MTRRSEICRVKLCHIGIVLFIGFMIVLVFRSGKVSPYNSDGVNILWPQTVIKDRIYQVMDNKDQSIHNQIQNVPKTRIVLIGAGPTTLGALYRLYNIGVLNFTQIQILVFEREAVSGGMGLSIQDKKGFIWNNGDHSGTSRYKYYNEALNSVLNTTLHNRSAPFVYMKGENYVNKFMSLDNYGSGDEFMQKYFRKMWTVDTTELNMEHITNRGHLGWEGLHFPQRGVWSSIADMLPKGWFNHNSEVVGIDIDKKQLTVQISTYRNEKVNFSLQYDELVSTAPLDSLIRMITDTNSETDSKKQLADQLLYSHVHIIGLGLSGKPPDLLLNKSIIYFPDSDVPFHRANVFSSYERTSNQWSMMFEIAQPTTIQPSLVHLWTKDSLIQRTIKAIEQYGFIDSPQIVSRYYNRIDHGYPIPSIKRDDILAEVQPWLESHSIYSRGLFGGWQYEVGKQDDSFMQGMEIVDRLLLNIPEQVYLMKGDQNVMKKPSRRFIKDIRRSLLDYEFVIARYKEKLDWILPYADHTHIYNKGYMNSIPDFRFQSWTNLRNVGREGHTYLYHIVHNYNTLADVTVFLQGQLREGEKKRCYAENVFKYVTEARQKGISYKAHEQWDHWDYGKTKNGSKRVDDRIHNDTAGEYWNRYFEFPHPKSITVNYYGCIGVTRERIHKRPRKMYEALMNSLAYGKKPKEGYFMEKFWVSLFSVFKNPGKS